MDADDSISPCGVWDYVTSCDLTESAAVSGNALEAATETLYALSGMRFGLCTLTSRPCRRDCSGGSSPWSTAGWWELGRWPRPAFFNGTWFNITCGGCSGDCSCQVLEEIALPRSVYDIVEVKVDGVVVSGSGYDLQLTSAGPMLVRVDGGSWPTCNDVTLPDTDAGTWSVTARYGEPVPKLGQIAVGELMCEFIKAMTNDPDCSLPPNVQTLTRQGITLEMLDPNTVFENGLTGLRFSDRFINTYNPSGLRMRSQVYDVDGMGGRITGWHS